MDDLNSVDDVERYSPPPLMCLFEQAKSENDANVSFGMISICPSTGDVVWDDFEGVFLKMSVAFASPHADGAMRIELEVCSKGFYLYLMR